MSNIEAFVSTYQSLFPGTPTPPMPSKPEDLGLSVRMAIRENNPRLWKAMFGGQGAPLPADIAMRVGRGEIAPQDVAALLASNYGDWAAQANQIREEIFERARQNTREREKAQFEAERACFQEFQQKGLLGRLAATPLSAKAIAQAREQWGITGR